MALLKRMEPHEQQELFDAIRTMIRAKKEVDEATERLLALFYGQDLSELTLAVIEDLDEFKGRLMSTGPEFQWKNEK